MRRFLLILLALALTAAACGDSDDGAESDDTSPEVTTADDTTESTVIPVFVPVDPDVDCGELSEESCAEVNDINCGTMTEEECIFAREEQRDLREAVETGREGRTNVIRATTEQFFPIFTFGDSREPFTLTNETGIDITINWLNGAPEGFDAAVEMAPDDVIEFSFTPRQVQYEARWGDGPDDFYEGRIFVERPEDD